MRWQRNRWRVNHRSTISAISSPVSVPSTAVRYSSSTPSHRQRAGSLVGEAFFRFGVPSAITHRERKSSKTGLTPCQRYLPLVSTMRKRSAKRVVARVFKTGRSQAVRLPKEFRFDGDTVLVHREGNSVVLEPSRAWPWAWVESFSGVPDDFERPEQGSAEKRRKL